MGFNKPVEDPLNHSFMNKPNHIELTGSDHAEWDNPESLPGIYGGRTVSIHAIYLDSFDWRLKQNGFELFVEVQGETTQLYIQEQESGHREEFRVNALPRTAHDLPESKWRKKLAGILENRALLKQVDIRGDRLMADIETGEHLFSLTVAIDRCRVSGADHEMNLPTRWRFTSTLLERKVFRKLVEDIAERQALFKTGQSSLDDALSAVGICPADPSALPRFVFDPSLRADAALKQVLGALGETMAINEPDLRQETDTEFLHDYRVALRRTRSVLRQMKGVFTDYDVELHSRGFTRLAEVTGDARDMDVFLEYVDLWKNALPSALRGQLEPLSQLALEHSAKAHGRLNGYLASKQHQNFLTGWHRFLSKGPPKRPSAERALSPIKTLTDARIWKIYRRVVKQGKAIDDSSPPAALHELRKSAKKLRYLIEIFQGLYPAEKTAALLKALKKFQDVLGVYQDTAVQLAKIHEFASDLNKKGTEIDTLLALGVVTGQLYSRQKQYREHFEAAFRAFSDDEMQDKFRGLFKPEEIEVKGA